MLSTASFLSALVHLHQDNMMYLVGKRQLPGAVVLLEFTEDDIAVDMDEMEPEQTVEALMKVRMCCDEVVACAVGR
jgi:hypothetical protein